MTKPISLPLTRSPIAHTVARGSDVTAKAARAFAAKYEHRISADYKPSNGDILSQAVVELTHAELLTGAKLKKVADMLLGTEYGMDPALAAYMKGHILYGVETFPLFTYSDQGETEAFMPRVFMINLDKIGNRNEMKRPIHRERIGQRDYKHAVQLNGKTSSHSNGTGRFAQMFNPYGLESEDRARVGLVLGCRPYFTIDRKEGKAFFHKKEKFACNLTIIFGTDLDMLMRVVDAGGELVKPLFYGENAYHAMTVVEKSAHEIDEEAQREIVRNLTPKPVTHTMGDQLKNVVVEPSASAAAPTDDSTSTEESTEEHISDSDSESFSTSDGDDSSSDDGDTTASASEPEVFRTAAQQRMFDAAEKKRDGEPTSDAPASV